MKFDVRYNSGNLEIEAENAVQAIIKIIDFDFNIIDYIDFKIVKLSDEN